MKVGIDLGHQPAEIGGGYTFSNDIFSSLLKLRSETRHEFIVFHHTKEPPQGISAEHVRYISLYRPPIKRLGSRARRLSKKIIHKVVSRNELHTIDWLQRIVLSSGVEIIWNLTPFTCITMEIPYITVIWDLQHRLQPYFPEVSADGRWSWRERNFADLCRRASVIITGTKAGKAEIEYFYQVPGNRIKILPHPTPSFALNAPSGGDGGEILTKYSIPDGYLFYPAQFWSHKNHAGLLLAAQMLRDKYNLTFPLVFVGSDRGNYKYVRELADTLELAAQVHFLGFVSQEDLISLYRKAFALTYVTFFGPENLPPLEAFAMGCPVIASDVDGAQEQLGDAAVLVDPKDPSQIALAVKSLHDDVTSRQTLIHRGLIRARKFTGEDFVRGILSVLDDFEPVRRCWTNKELYQHSVPTA